MRKTYTLLAAALLSIGSYAGAMLYHKAKKDMPQLLSFNALNVPMAETSPTTLCSNGSITLTTTGTPLHTTTQAPETGTLPGNPGDRSVNRSSPRKRIAHRHPGAAQE